MKWKKIITISGIIVIVLNVSRLITAIGGTWSYSIDNFEAIEQARLILLVVSLFSLGIALLPLFLIRKEATKKNIIVSIALLLFAIVFQILGELLIATYVF